MVHVKSLLSLALSVVERGKVHFKKKSNPLNEVEGPLKYLLGNVAIKFITAKRHYGKKELSLVIIVFTYLQLHIKASVALKREL